MTTGVSITSSSFLTQATQNFGRLSRNAENSAAQLTSGRRILQAGDDVASLTIAQTLQAQNSGLRQSSQNIAFNESLVATASSALNAIDALLTQASTAAQTASDANIPDEQRAFLTQELAQTFAEIDRLATAATFSGRAILDGSLASAEIGVGNGIEDVIQLSIPAADTASLFAGGLPNLSSVAEASDAATEIAAAQGTIRNAVGALRAVSARLATAEDNVRASQTGIRQATDALENINPQQAIIDFTLDNIRLDAATTAVAQARLLSADLLDVLEFQISENTGQETVNEADNTGSFSSQTASDNNDNRASQSTS